MAKRNKSDPLIGKGFRLPRSQIEFVKLLMAHQVFPGNESDVVRHLIERAIQDLKDREYVKKHMETMKLLRQKP